MTTASQGTVSDASSANIAHAVCPPLTAKWKLPLAAGRYRVAGPPGHERRPGPGHGVRIRQGFELMVHVASYSFPSAFEDDRHQHGGIGTSCLLSWRDQRWTFR